MARITTTQLLHHATNLSEFGQRAHQVNQDPAFQKARNELGTSLAETAKLFTAFVEEARSAWHRTDGGGSADFTRLHAA